MSDYQPRSNDSKWWWEDYDYNHRDYSYSKGSGSRSWMSKIGYSDDWWKPKKDKKEVYQELLNQLQNSANLIGDDDRGEVNVQWSNGEDINNISAGDNTIYLSPDNLLTTHGSGSEISEEILDAMTGKVYLASTLRETVSPTAFKQSLNERVISKHGSKEQQSVAASALAVWEAMETSIARKTIMENWTGFGPYIASDAERSTASKQDVQDYIDASVIKPNPMAASVAIAWNLLNANDPVTIPECYNECVNSAVEILENEIDADDRFLSCKEISNRIHEILKSKEEESGGDEGDENDGEGQDGDGNDDSDYKDDDNGPSNDGTPKVCDGALLGDKVENKTDPELSEQEAGEGEENEDGAISAKPPESLCDSGKELKVIKIAPDSMDRQSYKETVLNNRAEIRSIQSSLQFRANIAKLQSYGHRSGDIDENSLYKVGMNDDRVMMKSDVVSSKKIAICVLVDESGSMSTGTTGVPRFQSAKEVAVVLAESLKSMDGIEVCIYGHTAEDYIDDRTYFNGVVIREYLSPRQRDTSSLMQISARCQNHDSYAILHTANMFNKDYGDYDRKIMFVVSDGEPAGSSYGGKPARDHMLQVCKSCEKSRVEVYGIGVDNAFSEKMGQSMYGNDRFVILNDVKSSLGVMTRFIRQIAMK